MKTPIAAVPLHPGEAQGLLPRVRVQAMYSGVPPSSSAINVRAVVQRIAPRARARPSGSTLHGQLSQPKRLAALNKFKAGERSFLIATDVASRGIEIPSVDLVLNYELPQNSKGYIASRRIPHRVSKKAAAAAPSRW